MEKYVCVVCGWVYDEAVEGVKFEDHQLIMFAQFAVLVKTNSKKCN